MGGLAVTLASPPRDPGCRGSCGPLTPLGSFCAFSEIHIGNLGEELLLPSLMGHPFRHYAGWGEASISCGSIPFGVGGEHFNNSVRRCDERCIHSVRCVRAPVLG